MKTVAESQWPADKIERWPVERLVPYARNSRLHTPAQISQVAASIKEWGWTTPVLATDDGTIICGHARVLAAVKLGIESVPVMVATGWTDAQKRAYVIADNKLAMNSSFDEEMLVMELGDLASDGFDLTITGFSLNEVNFLRDGWNPDETPIEKVEEDGSEMVVVWKITVEKSKAEDVKQILRKALDGAGFAGTEIA